jgi:hypothetical protein
LRRRFKWIAALLTIALVFSQGLVAAHACTVGNPVATQMPGTASAVDRMPDCAGTDHEAPPPANLCETHCLPAQQAQQADVPTAPIAPLPALIVQVPVLLIGPSRVFADVVPPSAAPPPRLRFSRLLI